MQLNEPGVLEGSHYYFFTPSESIKKHYYHLICCGHYFCDAKYSIKRDYFPYFLLVYIRNGELYVNYRLKSVVAKKGDILLIDCREPHHYYGSNGLEFIYIHFDGPHSHELCSYLIRQHGFFYQNKGNIEIGKQLYHMIDTFSHNQEMPISESTCIIYNMINRLPVKTDHSKNEMSPVDQAIQYIKANINNQITLKEIASHVNLSPYYFSHLFKAETGYAPIEFVIKHRMDTAKHMLKTTSLSIYDIAHQVGYSSSSGFINIFYKKVGFTPTEFRNLTI
ncbi:AraC family transcriptional regulator [Halalkalibacterium halodurans]|uniref:helix-turn-helix transcriptional regulator n=1 Tax=Halalkalibacterium halodurans TaxID=86665 RepID=UPI002E1FA96A|nr:AraC family transcriptional regulator [Halalkalibacterium halodurans]